MYVIVTHVCIGYHRLLLSTDGKKRQMELHSEQLELHYGAGEYDGKWGVNPSYEYLFRYVLHLYLISGPVLEFCTRSLVPSHGANPNTLNTMTPLLNKVLLSWLTDLYAYWKAPTDEREALGISQLRGVGYGIGLAFALFVMLGKWPYFILASLPSKA